MGLQHEKHNKEWVKTCTNPTQGVWGKGNRLILFPKGWLDTWMLWAAKKCCQIRRVSVDVPLVWVASLPTQGFDHILCNSGNASGDGSLRWKLNDHRKASHWYLSWEGLKYLFGQGTSSILEAKQRADNLVKQHSNIAHVYSCAPAYHCGSLMELVSFGYLGG